MKLVRLLTIVGICLSFLLATAAFAQAPSAPTSAQAPPPRAPEAALQAAPVPAPLVSAQPPAPAPIAATPNAAVPAPAPSAPAGTSAAPAATPNAATPNAATPNATSGSPAVTDPATATPELRVVGHGKGTQPADFAFELDDVLTLELRGALAQAALAEYAKPAAESTVTLYLANVAMTGIAAGFNHSKRDGVLRLSFPLRRSSPDEKNRSAWDDLFKRQTDYEMKLPVSLGVGREPPVGAAGPDIISFRVAHPHFIRGVGFAALALFVLTFIVLTRWKAAQPMLKDAGSDQFSLGRAQMVFWGLLLFFAIFAIFLVMGTVERIPPQTLTLLGISGATGLAASLINRKQLADDKDKLEKLLDDERIAQAAVPSDPRLSALRSDIAALSKAPPASKGFFTDIVDDGKGPSFHRVQVVVWTLLLGGVFVHAVASVASIPEFPETLLLLMGISNGTYLGFKFPE